MCLELVGKEHDQKENLKARNRLPEVKKLNGSQERKYCEAGKKERKEKNNHRNE